MAYVVNMQHRLSNKDKEAMTAICAVCGPVEIKMNYRGYVMCRTKWREDQRKIQRNKKSRPYNRETRMKYLKASDGEYRAVHVSRLLVEQDYLCAICKVPIKENAHLDHDHETNKVRGLLCSTCNIGLGLFRDNIKNLKSAIEYLTHN